LTGEELFTVEFNSGFNALIGGRGSGKSALLEYLRFGLGRTVRDLPHQDDDASSGGFDRDATLIEETLGEDGYVEVTIERESVNETWYRSFAQRDLIFVTNDDDTETEITIEDAQRRFSARAFYQKGLSTTMNDSASASEQITGIAAAELLDKRRVIDASIEKAKRSVATAVRRQTELWQIQLERRRANARVADLKRRIDAIAGRLVREGVSTEALNIIGMAPLFDRAKNYQGQVSRARSIDIERLEALRRNFLNVSMASFEGVSIFPEIKMLDDALVAARKRVLGHVEAALNEMNQFGDGYTASLSEFYGMSIPEILVATGRRDRNAIDHLLFKMFRAARSNGQSAEST
jgi:chromosome segregation protein